MVSARAVIENILALILVIVCTIIWVVHSEYFYRKFADKKTNVVEMEDPPIALALPNIILCSRSPIKNNQQYTNNALFVQYLEEELVPNIENFPGRTAIADNNLQQVDQLFLNLYSGNNLPSGKSQVQNLLYTCRDVIYNCTWQGSGQSGNDCCNMVNTMIPTMNGICWSMTGNTQLVQNATGNKNGFTVRLQIDAYKYQRTSQPSTHPGFDVYLSDTKDIWRLINELDDPVYISSNEGVRINIQKTVKTNLESLDCGLSREKAAEQDKNAITDPKKTPLAACLLDYVIKRCQCHPLFSEFIDIDRNRNAAMEQLYGSIYNTYVRPCSTTSMSNCVQPYMNYLMPENYQHTPTGTSDVMADVKECMNKWHKPCQTIKYVATPEYYTSSQTFTSGFQAKFTVAYSTMKVKQSIESSDMNIIDLASYIGFAAALWFTVGHIIWSIARVFKSMCCKRETIVVEPKKERAPLTPYVNQQSADAYQSAPVVNE
uniref:Uncharacterized protein n=1 Tax=Plectus sambesii TaxID=2011161 RepID=A0A914W8J4_9BILA